MSGPHGMNNSCEEPAVVDGTASELSRATLQRLVVEFVWGSGFDSK